MFLSRDCWTPVELCTLPPDKWLWDSSTWQVNKRLSARALLPNKTHLSSQTRQLPYVSAVWQWGQLVEGLKGWESILDKPREMQVLLFFYRWLVAWKDKSWKFSVQTVKVPEPTEKQERKALKAIRWTCELQLKPVPNGTWSRTKCSFKNKQEKTVLLVWFFCHSKNSSAVGMIPKPTASLFFQKICLVV